MRMRERIEQMSITNMEIVTAFLNRKPQTGALSSNGKEIESEGEVVAEWEGDSIVMPDASNVSSKRLTRCRNLVRQMARSKGIKVTQID
jgi:hypothetical protein